MSQVYQPLDVSSLTVWKRPMTIKSRSTNLVQVQHGLRRCTSTDGIKGHGRPLHPPGWSGQHGGRLGFIH
jgi:hypothetical protein